MKPTIIINLAGMLLATSVSAAEWKPWTSRADVKPEYLRKLADGDETTVFGVPTGQDFGLETGVPTRINRLVVRYASLHGQFHHPKPQGVALEIWRDGQWRRVTSDVRLAYARWRDLAPLQMCGSVEWTHRFEPVETMRVRVVVKDCELVRRWCGLLNYRGVVVRELAATFEPERDGASPPSGKVIESAKPTLPAPAALPDGECLTDAVYQPSVSQHGRRETAWSVISGGSRSPNAMLPPGTDHRVRRTRSTSDLPAAPVSQRSDVLEICWPRRRMVNALQLRLRDEAAAVKLMNAEPQWWDGVEFRRVEKLVRSRPAPEAVTLQPPPVTTSRPSVSHTLQSLKQASLLQKPTARKRQVSEENRTLAQVCDSVLTALAACRVLEEAQMTLRFQPAVTLRPSVSHTLQSLTPAGFLEKPTARKRQVSEENGTLAQVCDSVLTALAACRVLQEAQVTLRSQPLAATRPCPSQTLQSLRQVTLRFQPVATTRLRLLAAGVSVESAEAWLDKEGQAFLSAAKDDPADVFGQAALADGEPDLGRVAGVMLPINFLKGFIGRPGDIEETMLNWNGALILRTGEGAERQHLYDRFVVFVLDDRAVGESPEEITRSLIDGWMPGSNYDLSRRDSVAAAPHPGPLPAAAGRGRNPSAQPEASRLARRVATAADSPLPSLARGEGQGEGSCPLPPVEPLRLNRQGLSARMTVFTTAPADRVYADRVHWEFQAARGTQRPVRFEVVLGKRLTMYAYYARALEGEAHPCIFAPQETGCQLDADGQTVRDSDGGVALWSSLRGEWGGTAVEPRLKLSVPLDNNGKAQLDLVVPHTGVKTDDPRAGANASYSKSLQLFREHWSREISGGTRFVVPEPAVNDAMRNALCQCLIIPDGDTPHYGAYWYEWCIGLEEWWPTIALAQFGRSREAKTHAAAIVGMSLNDPSHHFAYRNGLAGMGAAEVALLTGDRPWYRGLLDNLKARADWTIHSTRNDNRGTPYEGLIRKLAYGGDVASPAHSLYSNAACWRGLRDTGLMLQSLGEVPTAQRYLRAAETFRSRILELWGAQVDRQTAPPFVPHALDIGSKETKPGKRDYFVPKYQEREQAYPILNKNPLGNYWNLFMPMVLQLEVFPPARPQNGWIRDYAEQHGGVAAGLTRFRDGLDWHYGAGYIKSLLRSGQREKFLLSFYSTLAHGAADDARTSPEDCSIWPARTSNEGARIEYDVARWNWWSGWDEALSASPGVVLQLLRMMLIDEGRDADGDDGSLILLSGVPRRWLEHGNEIRIENAPTHYGPVSLRVASRVKAGRIEAKLHLQPRVEVKKVVLKLFHPERRPLRSARLNGRDLRPANGETLVFATGDRREFSIVALF